jgi:hypothetical protein
MPSPNYHRYINLVGRKLGNAIVAYFLRGCLVFWYAMAVSPILWLFS